MKSYAPQIIQKQGRPEWAVIPYAYYLQLKELEEMTADITAFRNALSNQQEELIPQEYADRLIDGENPIRVWREYRQMTQKTVAHKAEISVPYLSQLEHNERTASLATLKKIAKVLNLSLKDLT